VDLLSSAHPAQSASEYALTNKELDLYILTPSLVEPLRYLKIRFTDVQCIVVGECKNWQTLFTAKDMSGLVRVKYCNAPTMLLYCAESFSPSGSPPCRDIFRLYTLEC
jgi:hypothetical protein